MFLNRVLFKVKEPENAIIFIDRTENASQVVDALECTVHPFLSAVSPESITHFIPDPSLYSSRVRL